MDESPMENADASQQGANVQSDPPYWTSVSVAGLIFGLLAFILSLISTYAMINSEPTGSFFSPQQLLGVLVCLVGAFGGMVAIWHYTNEYDTSVTLGKGALIGFLVGVVITVVTIILNQLWQVIDPDMTQKMIDSMIANFEQMDMPEEQKQQAIDGIAESVQSQNSIGYQLLFGIPVYGILNLITGMIGAKFFGEKETEF